MTPNLNSYHLMILEYVNDKGEVYLDEIADDLHYNIPKQSMHNALEYLFAKKLLIEAGNGIHPSTKYTLTDESKQLLFALRQNNYNQQQRYNLEVENLKLQNEAMQYEATLRKQENQIRDLTTINLQLQNKNIKRTILIALLTAFVTFTGSNWQWVLHLFRKIFNR